MIVSHAHRFVFVHIPKTGGTTIENLLAPFLEQGRDIHVSRASKLDLPPGVKISSRMAHKHAQSDHVRQGLGRKVYDDYFSFAISRNPFARCYSAYRFMIARTEMDIRRAEKGLEARKGRRFESGQDTETLPSISFDDVCSDLQGYAKSFNLFRPQVSWLPKTDSVDFVGRLENLDDDLAAIFSHIPLPLDNLQTIVPANQKTAPKDWRSMSPESVAKIRSYYAADFERFGYSLDFDGPETAPAAILRNRKVKRKDPALVSQLLARIRRKFGS